MKNFENENKPNSRLALRRLSGILTIALVVLACAIGSSGCAYSPARDIPSPINMLLPKTIAIHDFTGQRVFDEEGGVKGMDVRIEVKDSFNDPAEAFGKFRFEMYDFRPQNADPRGELLSSWDVNLSEPKDNIVHWDNITRAYQFKLHWSKPVPVGRRFILAVVFESPYSPRLFAQREFVSGQ